MYFRLSIVFYIIILGCSSKKEQQPTQKNAPKIELLSKKNNFVAGDSITLLFKTEASNYNIKLQVKNAYGNTLLSPSKKENNQILFSLPKNYTRLAGPCRWKVLYNKEILLHGKLDIKTNTSKATYIESYFGPRSVTAGYNDYSMLTISPTDFYDNPLDDGTEVTVKYQFLENITELKITTQNFFSFYNVRSTLKSGRILVTSECNGTTSKELTTIVYPSNATNFSIQASSAHNYADGNQILTFTSDVIKDEFGNTVSNGTLVTFIIKNENNAHLYTIGTTLNGIVEAKTLHPDKASNWEVQAFVTGAAESNTIEYTFKSAIKDYPVTFSKGNRNIDIGPFESFMKQLVPDGILLKLDIYDKDGKFIETKKTTTKNGVCTIFLGEHFLPQGDYILKLEAAGISKEFKKNIHGN